jgi:hypothetical protein
MNCPFYGRHLFVPVSQIRGANPFLLLSSQGNQCALEKDAFAPCLFAPPEPIDWKTCPRVRDVRPEPGA